MATTLNLCPVVLDYCFSRGDTTPWQHVIKKNAVVVDVTGFVFTLTVDPSPAPVDALNNLFALVATIVDGPNGVIEFQMTAIQADQTPSVYFHDISQLDGVGDLRTISAGQFEIQQDIGK